MTLHSVHVSHQTEAAPEQLHRSVSDHRKVKMAQQPGRILAMKHLRPLSLHNWQWRCTPLVLALRQAEAGGSLSSRPAWTTKKVQDSHGYTEEPYLKIPKLD